MPAASCRMYPALTSSWCEATVASAGTSLRVGTKDLDILMRDRSTLPLQLAIHRLLDLLVRHRAVDEDPVDEKRRRSVHSRLVARLLVRLDQGLLLAAVEAFIEFCRIEADGFCISLQIVHAQLLLVAEHPVVHLPELALVGRAGARLRRFGGEGMEVEWVMAEHQPHLAVVLLHQLLDHRRLAPAEGALEIAELHDGHRRSTGAARRALGLDLDARQLRRLERHLRSEERR